MRGNLRYDFLPGRPAHSRNWRAHRFRCVSLSAPISATYMVLGHGARMAVLGVTIGVAAALALTRLMPQLLFGVSVADPLTLPPSQPPDVRSSSRMLHPSPPRHARRPHSGPAPRVTRHPLSASRAAQPQCADMFCRARPFVPAWSPKGRPSDVMAEVPLSAFRLRSAEWRTRR